MINRINARQTIVKIVYIVAHDLHSATDYKLSIVGETFKTVTFINQSGIRVKLNKSQLNRPIVEKISRSTAFRVTVTAHCYLGDFNAVSLRCRETILQRANQLLVPARGLETQIALFSQHLKLN